MLTIHMSQAAFRELLCLLADTFTVDEVRRWIPDLPDGNRIVAVLPGGPVSPAGFFYQAADILSR